jgi:hypothetical protein
LHSFDGETVQLLTWHSPLDRSDRPFGDIRESAFTLELSKFGRSDERARSNFPRPRRI